jgi:hypothetical protein
MITAPHPTTQTSTTSRIGVTMLPSPFHTLTDDTEQPTSGHGKCYACDCKGYRRSSTLNYCKCEHHYDRHA